MCNYYFLVLFGVGLRFRSFSLRFFHVCVCGNLCFVRRLCARVRVCVRGCTLRMYGKGLFGY